MLTNIIAGSADALNVSTTEYNFISGGGGTWNATETLVSQVCATAGTLNNLTVVLDGSPGGVASYVFTVYKNGSPTASIVTITGADTTGSDLLDGITFAAGDLISLQCVPALTPTARAARWGCLFTAVTSISPIFCRVPQNLNTLGASRMSCLQGNGGHTSSSDGANVAGIAPTGGTISKMYIALTAAPGAGTSWAFTVYKNEASTGLTATISDAATTGSDLSNSVAVVAGDRISFQHISSGTPASGVQCTVGFQWVPTSDGEAVHIGQGGAASPDNASTRYQYCEAATSTFWNTTENNFRLLFSEAVTIRKLYVDFTVAPGAGNSRSITVNDDNSNTALSVTISDTNTTGNYTSSDVSVAASSLLNLESIPVSAPTSPGTIRFGFVSFITTPSSSAIKTIDGLAKASVKTVNGLAIASVKTWDGLA